MDITPLIGADRQVIQSYGPGMFKVSGQSYDGAVIVFPDKVIPWDFSGDVSALQADDFPASVMAEAGVDVVLLGGGKGMPFISAALRAFFKDQGLALEAMDSGAACRTYNVLMAEGRRVAAAMLPV
ncbi:MAG: Mth938-like domain-containing protein [Rhodospirillales bacterium]|nr:Mth938-like domain-containing protein [Rhodospirillales bacterium]MCB9995303.1 Mth938-like domain-containing protein [Rhodospirillales bacterium]